MVVGADDQRAPSLTMTGGAKALAESRGVTTVHLSLSHDAGVATAFVIAEATGATQTTGAQEPGSGPGAPS